MVRKMFSVLFIIVALHLLSPYTFAQNTQGRVNCDLCGYCDGKPAPQSWASCKACLYPSITPATPESGKTLELVPDPSDPNRTTYIAPPTEPGSYYTMIGCIKTGVGTFTNNAASGSVVQRLFNMVFGVSGAVTFIYLLYGAFLIMTSQANPERLNQGKRIIYGAVIGILFIIGSVFIVNFIASNVLKLPGFGG